MFSARHKYYLGACLASESYNIHIYVYFHLQFVVYLYIMNKYVTYNRTRNC
jgi:hypothetical protein